MKSDLFPSLESLTIQHSLKQSLVPQLTSLVSLTTKIFHQDIVIEDLPFLKQLTVPILIGTLSLRALPSLNMLQPYNLQIHLKSGIADHSITAAYDFVKFSLTGLEAFE